MTITDVTKPYTSELVAHRDGTDVQWSWDPETRTVTVGKLAWGKLHRTHGWAQYFPPTSEHASQCGCGDYLPADTRTAELPWEDDVDGAERGRVPARGAERRLHDIDGAVHELRGQLRLSAE